MIDEPVRDDCYFKETLKLINYAISAIFVIEFGIRIIISGFCKGKHSFLNGGAFNVFDFFIVLTIILSTSFELVFNGDEADDSESVAKMRQYAKILGMFKALRPLKFLKLPILRNALESLVFAVPALKSAIGIDFLLLYIFGILGVQMLCGRLSSCDDEKWLDKTTCLANDAKWIVPLQNHDNIFTSMLTFFEIQLLEDWFEPIYRSIDSDSTK
jgi:hypothetical protein